MELIAPVHIKKGFILVEPPPSASILIYSILLHYPLIELLTPD